MAREWVVMGVDEPRAVVEVTLGTAGGRWMVVSGLLWV